MALTSDQWITFASSLAGAVLGGLATIGAAYLAARSALKQHREVGEREALWEVSLAASQVAGTLGAQALLAKKGVPIRGKVTDELAQMTTCIGTISAHTPLLPREFREPFMEATDMLGALVVDIGYEEVDDPSFVDPALRLALRLFHLVEQSRRFLAGEAVSIDAWPHAENMAVYTDFLRSKVVQVLLSGDG